MGRWVRFFFLNLLEQLIEWPPRTQNWLQKKQATVLSGSIGRISCFILFWFLSSSVFFLLSLLLCLLHKAEESPLVICGHLCKIEDAMKIKERWGQSYEERRPGAKGIWALEEAMAERWEDLNLPRIMEEALPGGVNISKEVESNISLCLHSVWKGRLWMPVMCCWP